MGRPRGPDDATVGTSLADEPPAQPAPRSDEAYAPTVASDEIATLDGGAIGTLPATEPDELPAGTEVGRYVVARRLGAGGMGAVYVARDPELDRQVALKLLHPRLRSSDAAQSRLRREARAMARLAHGNIVAVYDVGGFRDGLFLAMELIEGRTLRAWCAEPGRSWRDVLRAYLDAGRGLEAAHAAGIVHRDFKPENVLVATGGRVAVTDFGIARAAWDDLEVDSATSLDDGDVRLTRTGALIGTPAYMAPEQLDGKRTDTRSDQYSFCVALWEGLYGQRPLGADERNVASLREAVSRGALPPPPSGTRVPAAVHRALVRGLAVAPTDRWPSMTALLRALDVLRPRRWPLYAAIGGAAALGLAGVAVALLGSAPPPSCKGADAALAPVWSPARQQAIAAAFARSAVPFAADTWSRTRVELDDWARRWSAQRTVACEATWVRHEQSQTLLDARMRCLDHALGELDSLLTVLSTATAKTVEKVAGAADRLTDPARCADLDRLAAFPPPVDRDVAARVEAIERRLAELKAVRETGDAAATRRLAEQIAADAEPIPYAPIRARASDALGSALAMAEDVDAALAVMQKTMDLAEIARDDQIRASTALGIARLHYNRKRLDEAHRWSATAQAIQSRTGVSEAQRAAVTVFEAEVAYDEARFADAAARADETLALTQRLGRSATPTTILALTVKAWVFESTDRIPLARALLHTVLALSESYFGPLHPRLAVALNNVGEGYTISGRPTDAAMAIPYLQRAIDVKRATLGPDHPSLMAPLQNLGAVQYISGDPDAAYQSMEQALRLIEKDEGPGGPNVSRPLNGMGRILLDRHDAAASVPIFERANAANLKHQGLSAETAHGKYFLARALWESGQDRVHARQLMTEARAGYAKLGRKDDVADADLWLKDPAAYTAAQ